MLSTKQKISPGQFPGLDPPPPGEAGALGVWRPNPRWGVHAGSKPLGKRRPEIFWTEPAQNFDMVAKIFEVVSCGIALEVFFTSILEKPVDAISNRDAWSMEAVLVGGTKGKQRWL